MHIKEIIRFFPHLIISIQHFICEIPKFVYTVYVDKNLANSGFSNIKTQIHKYTTIQKIRDGKIS